MDGDGAPRGAIVAIAGIATGFIMGVFSHQVWRMVRHGGDDSVSKARREILEADEDSDEDNVGINPVLKGSRSEPHKLIFCVRTDLKMQKGKIAAQVGHAAVGAYKACARIRPATLQIWEDNSQPKIALQISSQQEALQLQRAAKSLGLTTCTIRDAGRTQVAAVRQPHFSKFP